VDEFTSKKIIKDLDYVKKAISSIDKTLALQHVSLQEHMRRTQLLEEALKPIDEHVHQVRGIAKFMAWLVGAAAAVAAFFALK
jgi:hypothetical protein